MHATLLDLPDLLHDAELQTGVWRPDERRLSLRFECLRRGVNGAKLDDRRVELVLDDVRAIALCVDTNGDQRPSTLADLHIDATISPWPWPAQEMAVTINSALDLETLDLAARTVWLHGSRADVIAPIQLGLHPHYAHIRECNPQLWVAAGRISAWAAAEPLSLDRWAEECAAWWNDWREEADMPQLEGDEDNDDASDDEDTRLEYQPPDEPAYDLASDLPADLQATLRDWFEGLVRRDWAQRTRASRNLDLSWEEDVAAVARRYMTSEFGRWSYLRAVDSWWVEGARAFVQARGIEHTMPVGDKAEDDTADNIEAVWGLELRRREGRWNVVSWSRGFPAYGSAAALPASAKPWLSRWRSGPVITRDAQEPKGNA